MGRLGNICSQHTHSSIPKGFWQHTRTENPSHPAPTTVHLIRGSPTRKTKIPGGRAQINFGNKDKYKHTHKRQTPPKPEGKHSLSSVLPPIRSSVRQQGPVPGLCGHCKFHVQGWAEDGVPLCKNTWAPLLSTVQRNASPVASPGVRTKQLPRTYQLLCWSRPAQVTVLLFVNRGLAGRGAGRKCNLLHLVAENREYN